MTMQNETAILVAGGRFRKTGEPKPYAGGGAPRANDLVHSAHPNGRPGKGTRWLSYFAPLAIIAVSVACAAVTVAVDAPQQALAAEDVSNVAQWVAVARGIGTGHAGLDF
jgi:hypothetical protein